MPNPNVIKVRHYNFLMAFVRKKTVKGRTYPYLVESRRFGKRVVQKILRYLGRTEDVVPNSSVIKVRHYTPKTSGK